MRFRSVHILATLVLTIFCVLSSAAQSADNTSPIFPKDSEKDQPKNVRDMMVKMRIDQEKKDFEDMLKRGEEALKLTEELENALTDHTQLSEKELAKLASLEKIVKKIRSELGGDDDDEEKPAEVVAEERPITVGDGLKSLKRITVKFVDELRKTTRFSISAAAIQTSNAVLRLTRFLRFTR